ncbi:LysE family translocator [Bacillus massilinigeriensis]|uniref:LysE family translocator n=1 Tax=Bacillus massilionigeriensis TaxID=1805475 RepID=UPI00096B5681|nr:LysE family translocator [Bacillus massilionigeriensis]
MITFVLVVLTLFIIPGPAVILTLTQSVSGGRKHGFLTGLGIAVGDLIHTIALVIGLSAIISASAIAFDIIKYLGAAYLFYLGVRAFLEKSSMLSISSPQTNVNLKPAHSFTQGVLTEVLNPKTALFFLSFLPQFVHPENGSVVTQLMILGLTFVALSISYTTLLSFMAGSLSEWLSKNRTFSRLQGKVVGLIYLGLCVNMALQSK